MFGGTALPAPLTAKAKPDLGPMLEMRILAAKQVAADPQTPLPADREAALEAVVRLRERPALLVRKNDFPEPPDRWKRLNEVRQDVRKQIPSAGRIDSQPGKMAGTGFVVAGDLVLTNRHVVELFADPPPVPSGKWTFWSRAKPSINFTMESPRAAAPKSLYGSNREAWLLHQP